MTINLMIIALIPTVALIQTLWLICVPPRRWVLEDQDFCCAMNDAVYA
jgi:hypothetical protein